MRAADAAAELEALAQFYGALAARQYFGDHVCLAAQPSRANGSVEHLVERGVAAGAAVTARWAAQIVEAVSDKSSEASILTALGGLRLELGELARPLEHGMLQSAMLGALDSVWEREHDEDIAPARFTAEHAEGAFSSLPFADAARLFDQRRVLPRPAFDALEGAAKRQAFTVAGMASSEMLNVTKAELARQLHAARGEGTGFNFRDFKAFAKERLESAGWTPANASHVETVFRTNAMGALASGRFVEMRQPAVVSALPYWQIRGVNDSRARPTHKAAFGIVLPANHPFWVHAYPPFGYNCLLPGTPVRGNFVGASRARYAGKAVELTTAKGRRLSVTANHPVLTGRGFIPARELREGDELVGDLGETGVASLRERPERHEYDAPARVEEVFGALAQTGGPLFTRAGADDFHGEAKSFRGEVEVVGSYANLPREMEAAPFGERPELALETAYAAALSRCTGGEALGRILLPAASDPSLPKLSFHAASVGLHRLPFHALRVAAPAELDAVLTEDASEGRTRDADLVGKLLERGAAHVALDQVRSVREFEFCGHVYDLQTTTGWMIGSGIVIGNCRCRVSARTKAWLERNGVGIGPVPRDLPDPGFECGTSKMLLPVPDKVLAPTPKPVEPAAPAHPPWLHPPLQKGQLLPSPPPAPVLPPPPPAIAAPPPLPSGIASVPVSPALYHDLASKFAATVTPMQAAAFSAYTLDAYTDINASLRTGGSLRSTEKAMALQEALRDAKRRGLTAPGTVFRGDAMSAARLADFVPGEIVNLRGFTSTTIDEHTASDFALNNATTDKTAVLLRIRQRSAVPVRAVSSVPGENELLVPHATGVRVINRTTDPKTGLVVVEVEEL